MGSSYDSDTNMAFAGDSTEFLKKEGMSQGKIH